ncbi:glycine oxidase maturase GoxB [Fodinicurvata sediminis]|uniref:glycine oxidase maturase GoxB n=1 Tax=Fodinicurvata sediminis TaxID=1121832 RepID=UPI0003B30F8F|nr:glycine oxidase maturase GoxB [Fodinicurvata sediminis]
MSTDSVAVIGSGPAGAAACLALGQLARAVLWITPPDTKEARIGESLSPSARPLLAALGLEELFTGPAHRPANALFSCWGSDHLTERSDALRLQGPGLVLDRPAFEAQLRSAALATGLERQETTLESLQAADGHWRLRLGSGQEVSAGFVIDCSGRKAVAGRHFARQHQDDQLLAAYAFLDQQDTDIEPTAATMIEAVADGWWYASLLPQRRSQARRMVVARFSDPDLQPRGLTRDRVAWQALVEDTLYIQRWIDSAGFKAGNSPKLTSAATAWLEPAAGILDGAGWAAAGDAAAAFDPLSSHGLTTALWSGQHAAAAADSFLRGDRAPVADYAHTIAKGVDQFRQERHQVYAREKRFHNQPFWRRKSG